jgi:hypothetical protein
MYWYKVTGYIKDEDKYGQKVNVADVKISVYAKDENDAIKQAKSVIKRPFYKITEGGEINPDYSLEQELRKQQSQLNLQLMENNKVNSNNNKVNAEINKQMAENIKNLAKAIDKLKRS